MRKLAALLAAAMIPTAATAQTAPPKLLVAISVDQLSSDLWDEYRPRFTGGFARLAQGTVFRNGYQSHAATETCPGHSNLLTAWHPARNGVIANNWIDQSIAREDKNVYCAEDVTVPGSTYRDYTVSAKHLKAPTLGDLLKGRSPQSRNVAVAGKDRAAVMMSGESADQRWYWNGKAFVSDLKAAAVPKVLPVFNTALGGTIATPRPALEPPADCGGKTKEYALGPGLTVGNNRFARAAGDSRAFRNSPEFDGATLALSAALIQEMQLGRGAATDVISIGLSATDYVGHSYGTGGMEMCLQLHALDRELGDFFDLLDRSGIDYAVAMTADHGALDIPERLRDQGVAGAARVDPALAASEVGKVVGGRLGLQGPVILGSGTAGDFWISRALPAADRKRVLDAVLATYRAHPQVEGAYPAAEIAAVPMPTGNPAAWTVKQRLRASYDAERSGDYLVVLKSHISPIATPSSGYVAGHGTPWDYDRRVPIVFWRKGMAAANRADPIHVVDIMPTAAAMIGLPLAAGSTDGRCVAGVQGVACPAR